jgi:hypothetical protein
MKLHRVHRERHTDAPRVAHRTNGSGFVHHFHYDAAMHVAHHVGVLGQHELMQR